MVSERLGPSATISFNRSRGISSTFLSALAHNRRKVQRLPGEHVQLAHKTASKEDPIDRASPAKSSIIST
jgi:hypothetical protein